MLYSEIECGRKVLTRNECGGLIKFCHSYLQNYKGNLLNRGRGYSNKEGHYTEHTTPLTINHHLVPPTTIHHHHLPPTTIYHTLTITSHHHLQPTDTTSHPTSPSITQHHSPLSVPPTTARIPPM